MILLNLDRSSREPLFEQIYRQVKGLIENGTLKPGDRLPPTRQLSEKLGVNRSTVYKAYEELWAMGYLRSRPGSYSTVRKRQKPKVESPPSDGGLLDWESISSQRANHLFHAFSASKPLIPGNEKNKYDDTVDMAGLDLDERLFPIKEFKKATGEILSCSGAYGPELFRYGDYHGYPLLREFIARRMRIHGMPVRPEDILVTNGAQNGFDLILKLLAQQGKPVIVEAPTYVMAIHLLKFYGMDMIAVPMTPQGIDLERLEEVFKSTEPAFLYTMPNFHNPTGITTDQAHREQLLGLCEKYRVPMVEDGFEEEMKYFGKVPMPVKSMDQGQVVIYLGTFSKILFPGLRMGWIAASREGIERLGAIKKFSDLSSNMFVQAALYEFCRSGDYDLHVKRMHRVSKKRMTTALKSLKKHLASLDISWHEPEGGYLIWLELENLTTPEEEIRNTCLRHGVKVGAGSRFFLQPPNDGKRYIRLSISSLNEEEIEKGISRFGQTMSQLYASGGQEPFCKKVPGPPKTF